MGKNSRFYVNFLAFFGKKFTEICKFFYKIYAKISDKAKQDLIRNLYDSLFKSAFKKTQEKLGIVYTPIEVVDFIIHSVEFALQKHFGKSLSDKGVHILDPFTGTGSFITRLIQSGLLDANLAHKYTHELWANEITLLAYYIAQLNITSVFHEQFLRLKTADKSPALAKGDTQKSPSLAEGVWVGNCEFSFNFM